MVTDDELEKLWRLYEATVDEMDLKALHLIGIRVLTNVEPHLHEGLLPEIRAMAEKVVEDVWLVFAYRACCGELSCLDNRNLADIPAADLTPFMCSCRVHLFRAVACQCDTLHAKEVKCGKRKLGRLTPPRARSATPWSA